MKTYKSLLFDNDGYANIIVLQLIFVIVQTNILPIVVLSGQTSYATDEYPQHGRQEALSPCKEPVVLVLIRGFGSLNALAPTSAPW
jgi:hypothetical protein